MKKTTNTHALLGAFMNRHKPESVTIAGLDEPIWLKKLTVGDQATLYAVNRDEDNPILQTLHLIVLSVCDEDGKPVFESIDTAKDMDNQLAGELLQAINKLNRFDEDAAELEKN